ncbi:MAG: hypothetical protein NVS9B15_21500 [Acidobacteriaceae bacterium]
MNSRIISGTLVLGSLLIAGCSSHESGDKNNKKVDIQTPMGSLNVKENEAADPKATGITQYPGAVQTSDSEHGNDKSANVNLSFGGFGLKVAAANFHSDDPQQKVMDFYKSDLSKYGKVLVCDAEARRNAPVPDKDSDILTCSDKSGRRTQIQEGTDSADTVLKAGTQHRQHIVAFKPSSKGTRFATVFVEIRGGDSNSM